MIDRLRWRLYRINSAQLHWLRRRFTPAGWLLLCALAGSAIWGVDTTQSMAYQSFTLCLALGVFAALGSLRKPGKVAARRALPRHGTAGEPLTYTITVENQEGRPRRRLSVSEDLEDPRPTWVEFSSLQNPDDDRPLMKDMRPFWFDRFAGYTRWRALLERRRLADVPELAVPEIAPRGQVEVAATLIPKRRGRLSLHGLTLSQQETLGLAKASRAVALAQSVLVLPKRYPVPRLSLPGRRQYQQGGVALASSVGNSQEFVGLRDYRPGDPPRRIHWRSFAKTGQPVVKEFQDEYFTRHALVLDTFAKPGDAALFEEAVSVAASFASSLLTEESLLDLLFVGDRSYCFTAGRGLGGAESLLEVLACAQSCPGKPFSDLTASVTSRRAALSGVVCVLIGFDEPRREFLARLRGLGMGLRSFVVTERPQDVPEGPDVAVLESGKIAEGLARVRA